jgi:hypothetical protein
VEHDDVVTTKGFALTYNTTVAHAVQLFSEFASKPQSEVHSHFIISGSLKTRPDVDSFVLVSQSELEAALSDFEEVYSQSLFSLERKTANDIDYASTSFRMHEEKCVEMLALTPNYDHFMLNQFGGIQSNASVRPAGVRRLITPSARTTGISVPEKKVTSMLSTKPDVKAVQKVNNYFEKPLAAKATESKAPKENRSNNAAASQKKQKTISFQLPQEDTKEQSVDKLEPVSVESSEGPIDVPKSVATDSLLDVNSDDEWDDGYKPDKSSLGKRAKAFGAPEGTGGAHQPVVEEEQDLDEEKKQPVIPSKKFVRGAIDDFVDDSEGPPGPRQKKRKLVPKV